MKVSLVADAADANKKHARRKRTAAMSRHIAAKENDFS